MGIKIGNEFAEVNISYERHQDPRFESQEHNFDSIAFHANYAHSYIEDGVNKYAAGSWRYHKTLGEFLSSLGITLEDCAAELRKHEQRGM